MSLKKPIYISVIDHLKHCKGEWVSLYDIALAVEASETSVKNAFNNKIKTHVDKGDISISCDKKNGAKLYSWQPSSSMQPKYKYPDPGDCPKCGISKFYWHTVIEVKNYRRKPTGFICDRSMGGCGYTESIFT